MYCMNSSWCESDILDHKKKDGNADKMVKDDVESLLCFNEKITQTLRVSTQSLCEDKLYPTAWRGEGTPKNSCKAAKDDYLNLLLHSVTTFVILERRKKQTTNSYFSLCLSFDQMLWLTSFVH